jgi:hypothetical protein
MSPVKYELDFYIPEHDILLRVKYLHLPEGQTGNAWEPSKPMLNSFPSLPCSVSHYRPLFSLHSHRRENLKSYIALTGWTL